MLIQITKLVIFTLLMQVYLKNELVNLYCDDESCDAVLRAKSEESGGVVIR